MITGLLEIGASRVLYDIRQDQLRLSMIRRASLSTGPWGLTTAHGIVGSPEWWKAVEAGKVRVETLVGLIKQVDGGPMGDTPAVRIEGGGKTESWLVWEGFDVSLIGKQVEVQYAIVPPRYPPNPDFVVHSILQVRTVE